MVVKKSLRAMTSVRESKAGVSGSQDLVKDPKTARSCGQVLEDKSQG